MTKKIKKGQKMKVVSFIKSLHDVEIGSQVTVVGISTPEGFYPMEDADKRLWFIHPEEVERMNNGKHPNK